MTPSRYLIARVALAFGINRRQRRMTEAAAEAHLLREAEQVLGRRTWEQVADVEELGIEYWNLRQLVTTLENLRKELADYEESIGEARQQRTSVLNEKSPDQERLETERSQLIRQLEVLAKERDLVVNRAREVRRLYEGLKSKLDFLQSEIAGEPGALESTTRRMTELRDSFSTLKAERDEIASRIEAADAALNEVEGRLESERSKHRGDAAEAFQQIGESNRRISSIKAEIGMIEGQMQQLFGEIGRHIGANYKTDPKCRAAARGDRSLVQVMAALQTSILLNQKLASVT